MNLPDKHSLQSELEQQTAAIISAQASSGTVEGIVGRDCPNDGREWMCQCARCGSEMHFITCSSCGGEGVDGHDCGEDCCACADPEDNVQCDVCEGRGDWPQCGSRHDWCLAHPMAGREHIPPHTPEWFPITANARPVLTGDRPRADGKHEAVVGPCESGD